MKKAIIGLALAAVFSASAQAATVEFDKFFLDYDDTFWDGATFGKNAKTDDAFHFGGLVNAWGFEASAAPKGDMGKTDGTRKFGFQVITITAKDGYELSSVTTGIRGNINADGNSAYAAANATSSWRANNEAYAYSFVSNEIDEYSTDEGKYSVSHTAVFVPAPVYAVAAAKESTFAASSLTGAKTAGLYLDLYAHADAYGKGSIASATLNRVDFSVAVAQVPEPETYAMFLAGLGIMGAMARRRKQA